MKHVHALPRRDGGGHVKKKKKEKNPIGRKEKKKKTNDISEEPSGRHADREGHRGRWRGVKNARSNIECDRPGRGNWWEIAC